MSKRLDGKIVLISGAARGMGASHARAVVGHGGKVIVGDILEAETAALAAELGDSNALAVPLDVRSTDAWTAAVAQGSERFGPINVLVNNAGILYPATAIEDTDDDHWQRVIDINLTGTFKGARAVIPAMKRNGGSIINISSAAGLKGYPKVNSYVASKWAVRGLTKSLAVELAEYGIRVNSVHPGIVATPMTDGLPFNVSAMVPVGRMGQPQEISNLVIFLASDESSFSTGAEFVADGGEIAGSKPHEQRAPSN